MRTHGSPRRSRAIWSRWRVSSFSRASRVLRSAIHLSLDTTRWRSVLGWEMPVESVLGVVIALAPSFGYPFASRYCRWPSVTSTPSAGHGSGGSDKCDGIAMDSLITAAARALAAGDLIGVLKRVGLRDDP